nr:glycosyltransferase [Microbacterium sp. SORGH_AS_0888]
MSTLTFSLSATVLSAFSRPSVVLIMNVANGIWIPLLWLMRIPTLVHVDGIEWERGKWGTVARAIFKLGAQFTKWFATGLIYDAREISRIWENRYNRSGYYIAYGGDTHSKIAPPDGVPSGEYALLVARFVPENSVREFLSAVTTLPDTPVVFVGSSGAGGDLENSVKLFVESRENAVWLGHVHDDGLLFSLWQHAGVYFHGHTVGGTNPALVQAMALGVPIVAVETPFNSEVLGNSGWLTARDPASIATAIERVIKDKELRDELSLRAYDRAVQQFSWGKISSEYDAALSDTISRGVRSLKLTATNVPG